MKLTKKQRRFKKDFYTYCRKDRLMAFFHLDKFHKSGFYHNPMLTPKGCQWGEESFNILTPNSGKRHWKVMDLDFKLSKEESDAIFIIMGHPNRLRLNYKNVRDVQRNIKNYQP